MTRCSGHRLRDFGLRSAFALVFLLGLISFPQRSIAQETIVNFDPAHTQISMTLDATMHTVHGTFKLKGGEIRFDPQTGKAQGEFVIDATSGDTDNSSRDKKMHEEVLESAKYPEITFLPDQVKGTIPASGTAQMPLSGTIRIHGQEHPLAFEAGVDAPSGNQIHVKAEFSIPYQKWGMKNPSNFLLRVGDTVEIEIDAVARLGPLSASATP